MSINLDVSQLLTMSTLQYMTCLRFGTRLFELPTTTQGIERVFEYVPSVKRFPLYASKTYWSRSAEHKMAFRRTWHLEVRCEKRAGTTFIVDPSPVPVRIKAFNQLYSCPLRLVWSFWFRSKILSPWFIAFVQFELGSRSLRDKRQYEMMFNHPPKNSK